MHTPKILLADDDVQLLREVGVLLKRQGYKVIPVEDGYQALDKAVRHEPDLLVLDVHMPAGNGFSVHERVLHHSALTICPVIYMTHDDSDAIAQMAEDHDAVALLYKPFDGQRLLEAVRLALGEVRRDAA